MLFRSGSFLNYSPRGAIVTNLEEDHMDHYGTVQNLYKAFSQFMEQVGDPELLICCGDDPMLCRLAPKASFYGRKAHCQVRAENVRQDGWSMHFDIVDQNQSYRNVQLNMLGEHNVDNALGVWTLLSKLDAPLDKLREAFACFPGVKRRCEKKWDEQGILFLDDYAHHPTEIQATLRAVKQAEPERRLVAVCQPHRFSRVKDCWSLFPKCFSTADALVITDIFSAGEELCEELLGDCLEIGRAHV